MYQCKQCGKEFEKRHSFIGHMSSHKRGETYAAKRETALSKEKKEKKKLPKKCKYCEAEFGNGRQLGGHITNCDKNPQLKNIRQKLSNSQKGKTLTTKQKKQISDSMKIAHKEKRAWNIGRSRWNNKESYPESFFRTVIEKEFFDKEYIQEYAVGIYSIDFAWPNKKLAIEIDGEQHDRFEEYKQRDIRKDQLLKENNWVVLRIKWKDMYNDPKRWIQIAYKFIHDSEA